MAKLIQDNREVKIFSALPDNELLFSSMSATERMSTLFEFNVDVLSENPEIDLNSLLGTDVTIEMDRFRGGKRHFHGYVARCSHQSSGDAFPHYQLTLRPWFWFLTRTSDCRIFQEKTVPEIIMEVFQSEGFSDVENRLSGSYETWDYCVQYRETDFNFVSRLMEQEGIYYYFQHSNGSHKLILSDTYTSHDKVSQYENVKYYPANGSQMRDEDCIEYWSVNKNLQPGKFVVKDFNFEDPKSDLKVESKFSGGHARDKYEIYDYPGEYPLRGDGEKLIKFRMEEAQAQVEVVEGSGDVQGLGAGCLFTLTECERADQNREYLVTDASYSITLDDFTSGGSEEVTFQCQIRAIQGNQQFRAPRITPKPLVQGPQTAMVVGPQGEEIWTDEYGRVKLQFHWDRYGKKDENSSCWVRVSQVWAGAGWGAIHIPRIGHEVIVECLEGDPDRPIVTGRVYNGDNPVPYGLPGNATQSGILSRSSKKGSADNFNEIRMEDKKGSEEVYIHAEKDQNNVVENNETTEVGNDRSEHVGNNEDITIDNNQAIKIGSDRDENVGSNESIAIGNNRTESVGQDETIRIGSSRSVKIGKDKSETIKANKLEKIGIAKELAIGGKYTVSVGDDVVESFGKNRKADISDDDTLSVGKNQAISVSDNQQVSIGGSQSIEVGKKLTIEVADEIVFKTGSASITLKKNGSIDIKGKDINLKGSGKIVAKASKDMILKGKKIAQN